MHFLSSDFKHNTYFILCSAVSTTLLELFEQALFASLMRISKMNSLKDTTQKAQQTECL
jgi:hypothetical protein